MEPDVMQAALGVLAAEFCGFSEVARWDDANDSLHFL